MSKTNLKPVPGASKKLDKRETLAKELEEMNKLDIESAKNALNSFLESEEWTRYGCVLLPQGQFVGNQINTSLIIVKQK